MSDKNGLINFYTENSTMSYNGRHNTGKVFKMKLITINIVKYLLIFIF
jgi:hypothetical protein